MKIEKRIISQYLGRRWPNYYPGYEKIVVVGDSVFMAGPGGLEIVSISNLFKANLISHYHPSNALFKGLVISKDYVYLADENYEGLRVIDYTSFSSPRGIAGKDYSSLTFRSPKPRDIALSGKVLFLIDSTYGLFTFDVSIPGKPKMNNNYWRMKSVSGFWGLRVVVSSKRIAYFVGGRYGLRILDCSNLSSFKGLARYDTPGYAWGVKLSEDEKTLYIADGNSGVQILDVSSPSNPRLIRHFQTISSARDIDVSENIIYIASLSDFEMVDVHAPSDPKLIMRIPMRFEYNRGHLGHVGNNGVSLYGNGSYACVTNYFTGLNIIQVNDPPEIILTQGLISYTENQLPVLIDSGLTLTDDRNNIKWVSVHIEDFIRSRAEELAYGELKSTNGELLLKYSWGVNAYQEALRTISFSIISDKLNSTGGMITLMRTIRFTAFDGGFFSKPVYRNINVTVFNDAPQVTLSESRINYIENAPPLFIDHSLIVRDVDHSELSHAVVRIKDFEPAEDVLGFTDQPGISARYNQANGTLSFSGKASVADYQRVLRSVTYRTQSLNPTQKNRTIEVTVSDGHATSAIARRSIGIVPVNDAPQVIHALPEKTVTPNTLFGIRIDRAATFFDPDNPVEALNLSVSFANGTVLPTNVNFNKTSDTLWGNLSQGIYSFFVTATDPQGSNVSTDFTLSVRPKEDTSIPAYEIAGVAAAGVVASIAGAGLTRFGMFAYARFKTTPVEQHDDVEMGNRNNEPYT